MQRVALGVHTVGTAVCQLATVPQALAFEAHLGAVAADFAALAVVEVGFEVDALVATTLEAKTTLTLPGIAVLHRFVATGKARGFAAVCLTDLIAAALDPAATAMLGIRREVDALARAHGQTLFTCLTSALAELRQIVFLDAGREDQPSSQRDSQRAQPRHLRERW
jgi:hypothetical protein